MVYNWGRYLIQKQLLNWETVGVIAMLVTSGYTPDADHRFIDSGSGATNPKTNEVSDATYFRQVLTSCSVTNDDTLDVTKFLSDAILFAGLDVVVAAALILAATGPTDDTDSPLLEYISAGGFPITANGSGLLITPPATGFLKAA